MVALRQHGLCAFLIAMLVTIGCSSSSDPVNSSLSTPLLPADLAKAFQIPNSTLSIHVYVDDATTPSYVVANVVVSDDEKTISSFPVELPLGEHQIHLEYVIVHPDWGQFVVARTNPMSTVLTPATASVDFSAASIVMPLPDNDGDGDSNLAELRAGTHPGQPEEPASGSNEYLLRVRVSGLQGTLLLTSEGQTLTATNNGIHTFSSPLTNGAAFDVAIQRQPESQECTVGSGARGTINGEPILIDVTCDLPLYAVTVMVSGLQGSGLVLQNNFRDDLTITGNGQASFATKLAKGRQYGVSVRTQPTASGTDQVERCIVVQSTGNIDAEDEVVAVECSIPPAPHYTIGGSVTGLKGRLVLRNGRDDLIVARNGDFQFALPMTTGKTFNVSMVQQPSAQQCTVNGESGQVNANVRSITVSCRDAFMLEANALSKEVELAWSYDDSALYEVYVTTSPNCDWQTYTTCSDSQLITNVPGSPYLVTGLDNDRIYYFRLVAHYGVGAIVTSEIARAQPGSLHPNGPVKDIAVAENGSVYLAGEFTSLAVHYGGGAVLDTATGKSDFVVSIEGSVNAVVADGQGGWYVGGKFNRVNGVARLNLAHILDDNSLDPAFNIAIGGEYPEDENVQALLLYNGYLYIGGAFTTVGGKAHQNLAAVELTDGAVTSWTPDPDQPVTALAAQAERIYVGGSFATISGNNITAAVRSAVAVFDQAGDLLDWSHTFWPTDRSGRPTVNAFAMDGSGRLFVGGWFSKVDETDCERLVAFLNDGRLDPNWQCGSRANGEGWVEALVLDGEMLYVGGTDPKVSAVDAKTGAELDASRESDLPNIAVVTALAQDGSRLIIGGASYNYAKGAVVAVTPRDEGKVVWQQMLQGGISALASSDGRLFAGGESTTWRGREIPRARAAALSSDGQLLSWSPNANGAIEKLVVTETTVYLMGSFSTVQGANGAAVERNRLAAFDTAGTLLDWNPGVTGGIASENIRTLISANGALYVGGEFTEFANQGCNYAAIVAVDGSTKCWLSEPNGPVRVLEADEAGNVFVGGNFSQLGSAPRQNLAAVDANGKVRTDWVVDASDWVTALAHSGSVLYVGGGFKQLNGLPRSNFAVVSTINGDVYSFKKTMDTDASARDQIGAMRVVGSSVIAAGNFFEIGGLARDNLVALSGSDLSVRDWNPRPYGRENNNVFAIAANPVGTHVYLGGRFTHLDSRLQPYFAKVTSP